MIKRFSGIFLSVLIVISMTCLCFAEISVNTDIKINISDNSYTLSVNAQNSDGNPLSYQWYECDAGGGNAVPIDGSTGSTFKPSKHDGTTYYYCAVTSTDSDGNTETVTSKIAEVKDNSTNQKLSENNPDDNKVPTTNNNNNDDNNNTNNISEKTNTDDDSDKKEIFTFSVTNIDEPVLGEVPDTIGSSLGEGYTISSITWNPADHHFQPNTAYTVTVNLQLDDDVKASSKFKCLINNHSAVINGTPSNGKLSFSYSFSPTPKLDEDGFPEDDDDSILDEDDDLTMSEIDDDNHFGIPGWLWFILLIIVLVSVGSVLLSKKKRNKKIKNKNNDNNIKPNEKKKSIISEKLGEIFSDDDNFDDEDEEENKPKKLRDIRAKEKSDIKEGKMLNKFDSFDEYEAMMNKKSNNPSGVELPMPKTKKEKIVKPKPKVDDNNITYFDSGSISGFNVEGFTSPLSDKSKKENQNKQKNDDEKE